MQNIEGKYFIDKDKYNCPFCKNKGVKYIVLGIVRFNEKINKFMYAIFVECTNCHHISLHLTSKDNLKSFKNIFTEQEYNFLLLSSTSKEYKTYGQRHINSSTYDELNSTYETNADEEIKIPLCIDEDIILHIPSSIYVIDERIPRKFRELIEEAEKCIKNNCLTGASACIRKTIYEFLIQENAQGDNYDEKIKSLKGKYKSLDDQYLDMLSAIQGIMCDQVHECTVYEKFQSSQAKAYLEILKEIFYHSYILPEETKNKKSKIDVLYAQIKKQK